MNKKFKEIQIKQMKFRKIKRITDENEDQRRIL